MGSDENAVNLSAVAVPLTRIGFSGAGAAGIYSATARNGGSGSQGIIVITYTPLEPVETSGGKNISLLGVG